MTNPRVCPNCLEIIPVEFGFSFDDKLNLICGNCHSVAFPACQEAENKKFCRNDKFSYSVEADVSPKKYGLSIIKDIP